MGVSKAEVNLRRLLRAHVHQTNDTKLVHYVTTMRSLLADLTGDPLRNELPTIPASRARDYALQIDRVAQTLRNNSTNRNNDDDHNADAPKQADAPNPNETLAAEARDEERSTASAFARAHGDETRDSSAGTALRRRVRGEGEKPGPRAGVRVDASLQSLVQRHRELQEGLTDEMVMLSAQLKESSLMMDQALHETDKVLGSTEDAVEASLASTNRSNARMGSLSSQSWKTSCLIWLILFVVFGMFMFMVVLIRVT